MRITMECIRRETDTRVSLSEHIHTHSYKTQSRTGNLICTEDGEPVRQSKDHSDTGDRTQMREKIANLALPLVDQPLLGLDTKLHLAHLQAVNHAEAEP